jgi:hypothetical protein
MIAITKSVLRQPATSGLFMADSDRGASLSLAMGLYNLASGKEQAVFGKLAG